MAINWGYNFRWQYTYAQKLINEMNGYDNEWTQIVLGLRRLMTNTGFDPGMAKTLTRLREKIATGTQSAKCADAGQNILTLVGAWNNKSTSPIAYDPKMQASAIKFLQHTYLLSASGGHCVWLHSLPIAFTNWAAMQMHQQVVTTSDACNLLDSDIEQFTDQQKKDLSIAAQHAMAWVQKTVIVLVSAASVKESVEKDAALAIIRRWFADPGTTESDLNRYIGRLTAGFKSLAGTLNNGRYIFTDWVPFRGTTDTDELKWWRSEAFTFPSRGEGMDVVYIESAFFKVTRSVLPGPKNWVRIVIHELSHLTCGTDDVLAGEKRYAHYGIGPHAGFSGDKAIENADSWAFFCADCANVLTEGERNAALKII